MLDPYRMVLVNIITSLLILSGTLFYRFIYPKKKLNLFTLLLIISFLPIISIFRTGDYQSGDFNIHVYRIISFYNSLREGIFMPSWAGDLNSTYGNPLFIFNYNLPYYVISLFHLLGTSFIESAKLYLALITYFSAITMYIWIKELTSSKIAAFTASVFYLFNPYHLIDVHFRATLGESTIFLIAPVLFYFITRYFKQKNLLFLLATCLTSAVLFLSHPLLATVFCGLGLMYITVNAFIYKNFKTAILLITAVGIGILGSVYMWIPFLLFSNVIFPNPNPNMVFYNFINFFYSPWMFGFLFQGPKGELELIIGYTQLLIVAICTIFLVFKKIQKKLNLIIAFWVCMFYIFLFLASPFSAPLWKYLSLFWMLLPFGRLMLPIALITSVMAAYFALLVINKPQGKTIIYILIVVTIGYTVLNWGHRTLLLDINDEVLKNNLPYSTLIEDTTAHFLNNKWADINYFWFDKIPNRHLEILDGNGIVEELERSSTKHEYLVDAKSPLLIRESTLYFPGWSIYVNNQKIKIYPGKRGVIYSNFPNGKLKVTVIYKDIEVYKISKIISILFFTVLVFAVVYLGLRRFSPKPKHFSR